MSPPIYAIGEKKPEKKFRASTGFEPVTSEYRCDALPTEYEATHWEPGLFFFWWVLSECLAKEHDLNAQQKFILFFFSLIFIKFVVGNTGKVMSGILMDSCCVLLIKHCATSLFLFRTAKGFDQ